MNDTTDMITISRADYEALISAKEELDDILAYDRAVAEGGEGLPNAFMKRLVDGENPLKVFRQWRGLTQASLSENSGVNRVQIADIEAGRNTGSVQTIKKLAAALDVGMDELV